jgi:hypothetical protein
VSRFQAAARAGLPRARELLAKPLRFGSRAVPTWWLLVGLTALFALVLVATSGRDGAVASADGALVANTPEADDADAAQKRLGAAIEKALSGDRSALAELRTLAGDSSAAWRALGRGYAEIRHLDASLDAYAKAIELDHASASDVALLRDVRTAVADPGQSERALDLAESLGAPGADLIYDTWLSLRSDKAASTRAAAILARLSKPSVAQNVSPALRVALELREAKSCPAFKELLPSAAEHADTRSLGKLTPLNQRTGCGFLGLGDCYRCLRNDPNLTRALSQAKATPAPAFGEAQSTEPTSAPAPAPKESSRGSVSRAGRRY